MLTLTLLVSFFAIGFMINGALKRAKVAMATVPVEEPATQMGR
jgi:hypothetical protein